MKTLRSLFPVLLCLAAALSASAADFTGGNSTASSSVLTNMMSAPTGQAKAYEILVTNTSASDVWVLAYDSATNKLNGEFSSMSVKIPAGATGGLSWPTGRPFRRGITVAGSTTVPALTNVSTVLTIDVTYLDRMF